ncbi:MAG: hypothetical protein JO069_07960 [Verrucomicrobia bacterium]|nr:hypothetical protein [Verrucomicrobiota bacterium]
MRFHWRLSAAFVAVFLIGAVCGSVLTYSLTAPGRVAGRRVAQAWETALLRQLGREVKFTPEQAASFRPEIEEAVQKARAARRQALAESDLEIDAALARIGDRLGPDQKFRMDQFRARRRARVLNWIGRQAR